MTITIYIDWFLPAYKAGGPIQSIANLVSQAETGINYRIICSNRDLDGTILNVPADQWMQWNPWTQVFYASRGIFKKTSKATGELIFINGIYSMQFAFIPLLFSDAQRKIVAARGMLHAGALLQKPLKKKLYLAFWKLLRIHRRVEFHAVDKAEETAIRAVFGEKIKVHIAANLPRVFTPGEVVEKKRGELHLLTVALLGPMKNILMVLKALQMAKDTIYYHIYGPVKDHGYWQQCLDTFKFMPSNVHVHYYGEVHPSGVEEVLQKAQVFILPSKSENFGHAIYEALSAGKPVITSLCTPWNNLEGKKAGKNLDSITSSTLNEAIRFFASMDRTELQLWSEGARAAALAAINMASIRQRYRVMFGVAGKLDSKNNLDAMNNQAM